VTLELSEDDRRSALRALRRRPGVRVVDVAPGIIAVPFHHYALDASGRRLTLFWNGLAGEGRRTTVELERPLGDRSVWDRRPGVLRPEA
jgi:hypothetical protein